MRSVMLIVAALLVASAVEASAMSIEAEPVKVTHRNSGPRYDIDEVERTKLMAGGNAHGNQEEPESGLMRPPQPPPQAESPQEGGDYEARPVGHVAIRRIFLFPMIRPTSEWSSEQEGNGQPPVRGELEAQPASHEHEQEGEREPMPSMFAKPFWPFMTPARPSPAAAAASHNEERPHRPHHHLFGADEASRSPNGMPDRDQDKATSDQTTAVMSGGRPQQPLLDPIQVMMDLMHQAIAAQLGPNFTPDLNKNNKEPSASNGDNAPAESNDERPMTALTGELPRPPMMARAKNETHEDIVDIDGKKYLRKTIINKHVGEGIIFMTRRLIFVPLNETDSATTTTDTMATTATPDSPPITTALVNDNEGAVASIDRVGTNKPKPASETTTEQAATITTTSEPTSTPAPTSTGAPSSSSNPTTTAPSSEQPTTTGESNTEDTTTSKSSWVERASEVVGKAAERLVEEAAAAATTAATTAASQSTSAPAVSGEAAKPAESSA